MKLVIGRENKIPGPRKEYRSYHRKSKKVKLLRKWHKLKAKWRYRFRLHKNHANCIHWDTMKGNCKAGHYTAKICDVYEYEGIGKPFNGRIQFPKYDCCTKHAWSYSWRTRIYKRIFGPHN